MTDKNNTVFIAPLNWGLGHATRDLPLIRRFIKMGWHVIIAVHGRARTLLESEVPECTFVDFPEYPIRYPNSRFFLTRFMFLTFPQMLIAMWREKKALNRLIEKYRIDLIISDNRFCLYHHSIPSLLISHQLRYILPFPINKLQRLPEYFNAIYFRRYSKIVIPDESEERPNLTGVLSHHMHYIPDDRLMYSGILADIPKTPTGIDEDIDYFIIVSGPEPQRSNLEKLVFAQVNRLSGKIVVALGRPERNYKVHQGNALFYAHMDREQIARHLARSKFVIGRPGYTSVMEIVTMKKRALFIPTPGQIEQEYLAKYYQDRGWFHCVRQNQLSLADDVRKAESFQGFPHDLPGTEQNVRRLIEQLFADKQVNTNAQD